jgi:peroxiredoxin
VSLGPIASVRQRFAEGVAPEFDLVDREGQPVSLSLYADKKVILMTWASW